jgi:HlyD family secretion protein
LPRRPLRFILLLLGAILLIGGAASAWRGFRGSPDDRIRVSGNIELNEVKIAFKTSGRLEERKVDEGDAVTKAMVVARLDQQQLLQQRERDRAMLQEAEAQLAQARIALELQSHTLEADIESRRADVSVAEARFLELSNGARPQEIQEAKAAVDAAKSELDRAQAEWERIKELNKSGVVSASQYDLSRQRAESAAAILKQTQERAALILAGTRPEQISAAAAQVSKARAALKSTEAARLDLKRREQEIQARQAEVDRARAQLALTETQLADTVVASPISGVVLVKSANPGEILAPGTSVLTVGDIEHPWLRAYINEPDLGRVKLGTPVRVTTDAFPGKIYEGRVSFISSDAEFTPKQIQTTEERVKLVYRIKIDVDNPKHELKSNMPADAEILTGR